MPLFHRESAENRERRLAHESDQAASLESLRQGGLPIQATRRLHELSRDPRHLFTSDFSVDEFALSQHEGFQPVTQVMGSCFYHVGWVMRAAFSQYYSHELDVLTAAYDEARRLALSRMWQEAQIAGANAVVGVHLKAGTYEWSGDVIEYTALGTAVRFEHRAAGDQPALTNLSGQDFWKLLQNGYWPVGLVAGNCVFYVAASWRTQSMSSMWGTSWWNQEIGDFSQGLQVARHMAQQRLAGEAHELGADGVVGVTIQQKHEEHEVDVNDQKRTDMIFTFLTTGTAIRALSPHKEPVAVTAALGLEK